MKYLIILLIVSYCHRAICQEINWQSAKSWKIYQLRGHGLFTYSVDTLRHFQSYSLNTDSMLRFVKDVTVVSLDSMPIWMGVYVASCLLNGKVVKIEISKYGGFFYCEANRRVYQVPSALKNEWQDYLVVCYRSLYP